MRVPSTDLITTHHLPQTGIEIDGHYRETEATRLAPLPEAEAAAA